MRDLKAEFRVFLKAAHRFRNRRTREYKRTMKGKHFWRHFISHYLAANSMLIYPP